jgi:hypothetical protein
MNLLVTLIGNAVVDADFRKLLFENPLNAADEWGFHLTKGEVAMLEGIFDDNAQILKDAFATLEDALYLTLNQNMPEMLFCKKPCSMSLLPPPGKLRDSRRRKLPPAA